MDFREIEKNIKLLTEILITLTNRIVLLENELKDQIFLINILNKKIGPTLDKK